MMNENELLERTLAILEHTNKQVGECLRMMAEKDAEIAKLEFQLRTYKDIVTQSAMDLLSPNNKEDVNHEL